MARVVIAQNQEIQNIPEGVPLAELATIAKSNSCALTNIEKRAQTVKKNKVFNPNTLKKSWDAFTYNQLTSKLNKAKLMKFISAEPKRFHPFWVGEFYELLKLLLTSNHSQLWCTIPSSKCFPDS